MPLIDIPKVADVEKGLEQAEDHLGQVLDAFRTKLIADFERILDERTVIVSFPRKVAPKTMDTPQ